MPVWKPAPVVVKPVVVKPVVVTPTAVASAKGAASSAVASSTTQSITQIQSVGNISGNNNVINFANQTASNTATTKINTAIAWGANSTATATIE
jgi:hypothetical protein